MIRRLHWVAPLALAACAGAQKPAEPAPVAAAPAPAPTPAPPPPPPPPTYPKAAIQPWGFDLGGMDAAIKPGDDFFRYSAGNWIKNNKIPEDRSRYGVFDLLAIRAEEQVKAIIDETAAKGGAPGTLEQKIADFFNSYVDVAAIEAKGLKPLEADLALVRKAKTHDDLARLIGRPDLPLGGPVNIGITIDQKNPDRYILAVSQGGLGMPDRDYYLKDDARSKEVREKYLAQVAKMLGLTGLKEKEAAKGAQEIVALETEIAKLHWERAKSRERDLTYNLRTKDELKKLAPDFPWDATLTAGGLATQAELVLRQLDAIPELAKLFRKTPVATWKLKMTYQLAASYASVLPKAIDEAAFSFSGRVLSGQPQQRERWKRGVSAVGGSLGEAVGALYVARHFPPEAKAKMLELVENLRKAYAARIDALPWMTAETKKVAKEKLAAFRPKIGYPDKWRDYSKLEVVKGDAYGNAKRAAVFAYQRQVERMGKPTDREEWGMTPQTVNAYYNPTFNEIVFPAAILQPPFFDPEAEPALNYGGIGAVIGHEMGHGFDDQGAKSDAKGILRTWWSEADVTAFKKLGDALVAQYSSYEALPGLRLNGRLNLGENIGDNGGLQVAYEAYRMSLGGKPAPVLDGFTGDQRFFLGFAQIWRSLIREAELRNRVLTDSHAPGEFRIQGTVRNMDAWYAAFGVKEGDKMYLPPEQRVKIW